MPENIHLNIDSLSAIRAVSATLRRIDPRLIDHGERVAYVACALAKEGNVEVDMKTLFVLSIFHDIGAYKTDEIDRMVEFESENVHNHSIYGYLFLKYLTPLSDYSEALLYHHTAWADLSDLTGDCKYYAALIYLADRFDIALKFGENSAEMKSVLCNSKHSFNDEYVNLLKKIYQEKLFPPLKDGSYRQANINLYASFMPDANETLEYLKMIVYSIDFRSDHTVTHTVNTVSLAVDIARHFGLSDLDIQNIYIGSLLHDVGKIAIPPDILEYPGKLNDSQMTIMRTHVEETASLIEGIVPDDICQIAIRHHEKLDGSGYPCGLFAPDLTMPQRIVAVADIVSALSSRRSYKEPFPKERTLAILKQMSQSQLDPDICQYVSDYYDEILNATEASRLRVINQYQSIMDEYEKKRVLFE